MWDKEGENQCQGDLKMLILALKLEEGLISQLFKEFIKAEKYKRILFHCQPWWIFREDSLPQKNQEKNTEYFSDRYISCIRRTSIKEYVEL